MYLDHAESVSLAHELSKKIPNLKLKAKTAVFPSALSLLAVQQELKGAAAVGAQNVYWVDKGGYTGEVSAEMYGAVQCEYALVGHSERRHVFHETNADVRHKLEALLAEGLTPVICVGETLHERKEDQAKEIVEAQVRAALTDITWPKNRPLIIAYEPVWAIGTNESCDPAEAERMASLITTFVQGLLGKKCSPAVLYGGSVRPDNVAEYIAQPHLNGVLVGGASAKLDSWVAILSQAK